LGGGFTNGALQFGVREAAASASTAGSPACGGAAQRRQPPAHDLPVPGGRALFLEPRSSCTTLVSPYCCGRAGRRGGGAHAVEGRAAAGLRRARGRAAWLQALLACALRRPLGASRTIVPCKCRPKRRFKPPGLVQPPGAPTLSASTAATSSRASRVTSRPAAPPPAGAAAARSQASQPPAQGPSSGRQPAARRARVGGEQGRERFKGEDGAAGSRPGRGEGKEHLLGPKLPISPNTPQPPKAPSTGNTKTTTKQEHTRAHPAENS
jgi:hypothetical protein